jgi:hypothetical protein
MREQVLFQFAHILGQFVRRDLLKLFAGHETLLQHLPLIVVFGWALPFTGESQGGHTANEEELGFSFFVAHHIPEASHDLIVQPGFLILLCHTLGSLENSLQ